MARVWHALVAWLAWMLGSGKHNTTSRPTISFGRVERDLAAHDLSVVQSNVAHLTPSQARHLSNAATILATSDATDEDIGVALAELRYAATGLGVELLITNERLDSPEYHTMSDAPLISRSWLTHDVCSVAWSIRSECRLEDLPVLADALADAGCDDPGILGPLRRRPQTHRAARILYAVTDCLTPASERGGVGERSQ
jgi:hypothetical protein